MEGGSWAARFSSVSKRYQSAFQTRSDVFMGFEEIEGDEDIREELPCPFCAEYFDIVGLCCHIDDEHPIEAKNGVNGRGGVSKHSHGEYGYRASDRSNNGVCPVCAMRVGVDMVAHITLQHGNIFKRKRKSRKNGSHSTLSLLRKELQEGNLQTLFGGSSCILSSSNASPDPLLSSFILPMGDDIVISQSQSLADTSSAKKGREENVRESGDRFVKSTPLSIKDQEERARRSEFVHGLLMSTIFEDKS